MIIFNVTKDKVSIKQDDTLNRGEYNVTKCKFLFSKEYDGLVKEAIFFIEEKNIGILLDENDECNIPQEAFEFRGNIEIGLYAYYTNNDKLEKRYSPSRTTKVISDGSYTSEIDNTEEITPTDKEQMNSIIKNNVEEIKRLSTNKVDKRDGYNLSKNDFSDMYKKKLDGIEQNAQVNKIEKIFINNDEMPIVEKNINITIPTKLTDLKNDNNFVNDKNYVHTDNNFTHAEKEKLKELNNYDDSSLNEKIVENSNSILENKKDIQNLKETSEKNTSNINEFNKNLQNYSLVTETGYKLDLSIDNSTYVMTLKLLDKKENVLSTGKIDLPIESMIINVSYDSNVKRLTFSLQNGNIINVPLNDLISGLVTEENLDEILKEYALKKDIPKNLSELKNDSNYVKNTDYATRTYAGVIKGTGAFCFTVDSEGQPKLNVLDYNTYKQYSFNNFISKGTLENVIEGKKLETKNNKVISVSKNSTDEQYPSAKCTYEIKKELEKLKDEILEIGEASDSFIHVEDSTMSELQELSVDGVCEQETITGSQLYNINTTSIIAPYVSKTDDDWITVSASNTTSNVMYVNVFDKLIQKLKTSTDYTIVVEIKSVSYEGNNNYFHVTSHVKPQKTGQFSKEYQPLVNTLINNSVLVTHNTTLADFANSVFGLRTFFSVVPGGSVSITFRLSVLESLDITSSNFVYEKYTGYQPSPSPDYPQDIKTITDSLIVTSCNKNFLKMNDNYSKGYTTTKNGITLKVEDDLSISLKGTATAKTEFFLFGSWSVRNNSYLPKEIFTISQNGFVDGITSNLGFFKNGNNIKNYGLTYTKKSNTFNLSQIEFDGISYAIAIAEGKTIDTRVYMQIESGKKTTSFEEQLQSQITANLPEGEFIGKIDDTYKDALSVDLQADGKYHFVLNKNIGKRILNSGDMSSRIVLNTGDIMYRTMKYTDISINKVFIILCNRYVGIEKPANRKDGNIYWNSLNRTIDIIDNRASITTIDEFKTWLSTHNLEVYYVLENPYKVDLGIVDMPFSFDEVTNIFTDSDLLPKINATYYKNFISTIRNLQVNNDNLKNELMSINNRLAVLESANASTISDEEESEVVNNE